jgi:hypothetical protein
MTKRIVNLYFRRDQALVLKLGKRRAFSGVLKAFKFKNRGSRSAAELADDLEALGS